MKRLAPVILSFAGIATGLVCARVVFAAACHTDSYCGTFQCGALMCQCCSRGSGVHECCPTVCTNCTIPVRPPPND